MGLLHELWSFVQAALDAEHHSYPTLRSPEERSPSSSVMTASIRDTVNSLVETSSSLLGEREARSAADTADSVLRATVVCDEPDEVTVSFNLLLVTALLIICFLTAYALRQSGFTYLHESGSAIIYGVFFGSLVRLFSTRAIEEMVRFDSEGFFLFLLPPIIFESGYNMRRRHFFRNFVSICMFALVGTLISTFLVGMIVYVFSGILKWTATLTFVESLTFGALISATDPVTVLAIFKELHVDVDLYANVFGESVLNDAVAIVLYKTVISFQFRTFTGLSMLIAVLQFLLVFGGSLVVGVVTGLLSALIMKYTKMQKHESMEAALLILYAYTSYLLAEGLRLSGIVSVLFCGITMAHYTYNNLGHQNREFSKQFFEVVAFLAETSIFVYLGFAIFSFEHHYDFVLITVAMLACLLARGCNVFPLAGLVNLARRGQNQIPTNHQVMMWFSGLRGAIAFSLALEARETLPNGHILLTTTLVIVLFTVLVFGGLTTKVLQLLQINIGVSQHDTSRYTNRFLDFDRKYLKPFFTDRKPFEESTDNLVVELDDLGRERRSDDDDDDDDDDYGDGYPIIEIEMDGDEEDGSSPEFGSPEDTGSEGGEELASYIHSIHSVADSVNSDRDELEDIEMRR